MADLYYAIDTDIRTLFATNFVRSDVTVTWRSNDPDQRPDPLATLYYLRNIVHFGREKVMSFGGGLGNNQRLLFGSVSFLGFAARSVQNENNLLSFLSDATKAVRGQVVPGSYGESTLSFIGDGSGFDVEPEENGNWFVRGCRYAYEYRFLG